MTIFILMVITGLLAGWLAGENLTTRGFGMQGGLLAGMAGAVAGGYLWGVIPGAQVLGLPGVLVGAALGASLLLGLSCLFRTTPAALVSMK